MADFELLQRLCQADGVSGREDRVRELILTEIAPYCTSVTVDPLGNIIAEKRGQARPLRRVMLDAHMDEVGLIVTDIGENGELHFKTVGGIDEKVLAGIPVAVGNAHIPGVIGVRPIHLTDEPDHPIPQKELTVDIGADSREEAEPHVQIGDYIVFCSPYYEENGVLHGKAFDDRAGCAALIELIRRDQPYDLTFVFSVQEELGLRGAKTAAYTVAPDAAVVLEATTAGDLADVPEARKSCRLRQGAAVSFMDGATSYDRAFYALALDSAKQAGVSVQTKQTVTGGNNAGAIHVALGGIRTVAVSVPCRYLHAPMGLIARSDYEAVLETAAVLSARIAAGEG